jgi:hypothetical protein
MPPSGDYLLCIGIAQVAARATEMHQLCWLLAVLMASRHSKGHANGLFLWYKLLKKSRRKKDGPPK